MFVFSLGVGVFANAQIIKNGYGKTAEADGTVYEGQFKNGECEGYGKMTRPNGYHYEGEWKNSRKHGSGKGINVHEGVAITYEGTWNMGYAMQIINAYY